MERLLNIEDFYKNDPNIQKEDVKLIMDWCKMQPHLPKILEIQAALALHCTFYSVEAAKNVLDQFFTIRTATPGIFANTDPKTNELVKQGLELMVILPVPKVRTPKGCNLVLMKLLNTDASLWDTTTAQKFIDMTTIYQCLVHGPAEGFCYVWDLRGATLGHLARTNISLLQKFATYAEMGLLARIVHLHCIYPVAFMDKILALVRPFIGKEFFEKIVVHTNIDEVYQCVPKEIFPEDYGGKAESVKVLHEKFKKLVNENQWLFSFIQSQVVDETKRIGPSKASHIFGSEGTFKKMDID